MFKVRELTARVAKKLGTTVSRFIYTQVWQGLSVEGGPTLQPSSGGTSARTSVGSVGRSAQHRYRL